MILVDGHVHIYSFYNLTALLDASWSNFDVATTFLPRKGRHSTVLLLAERGGMDWYQAFRESFGGRTIESHTQSGSWVIEATQDESALRAVRGGKDTVYLIAGRQISTREGLEVLALATGSQFDENQPLEQVIDEVLRRGALAVLPWSPGKWMGNRGRTVIGILNEERRRRNILIGDISNRPRSCLTPRAFHFAFENHIGILRGTDPLPFPGEESRVGSFGSVLRGELDDTHPSEYLRECLQKQDAIAWQYGELQGLLQFMRNQLLLQMQSRGCFRSYWD